jgi:RNA polymerase sigma factor (sigma-70 family)
VSQWAAVMEQVVRERRPVLVGYAYLFCGSRSDAEEITQEAIVRTFARGRAKTSVQQAESYIRRAIINEAIDRSRRRKVADNRRVVVSQSEYVASHDSAVAGSADLEAALALLAPRERAVVVLKYVDDLTNAQIGAALGLATGTVKRYLYNAGQKLRESLGENAVNEDIPDVATVPVLERRYA